LGPSVCKYYEELLESCKKLIRPLTFELEDSLIDELKDLLLQLSGFEALDVEDLHFNTIPSLIGKIFPGASGPLLLQWHNSNEMSSLKPS
jgi:hypothetical protein